MKQTGLSFMTTVGVFAFGTFVFLTDANAASDVTFVAPPPEQSTYQMVYADYSSTPKKSKIITADSSSETRYGKMKTSSAKNFFKKIFSKIKFKKSSDSEQAETPQTTTQSTSRSSVAPVSSETQSNATVAPVSPKNTPVAVAKADTNGTTSNIKKITNPLIERLRAKMAERTGAETSGTSVSNATVSNDKCVTLGNTPKTIYNLTRLLDYSPHPTTEYLMQDQPVLFNGKQYWFVVTYNEDWKESKDSATMTGISFKIDVMENNKKVRDLTTPKVTLNKKTKKGQVIGIAEVAPFKFNIKVDSVSTASNGAKELVFSLDIIG